MSSEREVDGGRREVMRGSRFGVQYQQGGPGSQVHPALTGSTCPWACQEREFFLDFQSRHCTARDLSGSEELP